MHGRVNQTRKSFGLKKNFASKNLCEGGDFRGDCGELIGDDGNTLSDRGDPLSNVISTLFKGSEALTEWKTRKSVMGAQRLSCGA